MGLRLQRSKPRRLGQALFRFAPRMYPARMDSIYQFLSYFLHLDETLGDIIRHFGGWSYGILFAIIFCETGFVVTPFLPGDSLLFAAGTFAAIGSFNIWILLVLLIVAAIAGDTVNYWIGRELGVAFFDEKSKFPLKIKKEYLLKTQRFYEKYGGKTIILARFVPIVRTFAPFVAGVGRMDYGKFLTYNFIGGVVWVSLFTFLGFFFGNIPIVKENFEIAILAVIFISLIPPIVEWWRERKRG